MHKITLFFLVTVFAVALAEGQYYVPRAYYTIDAEGHESAHVPLRRLRRSLLPNPYPYGRGGNANANANADARGGGNANANANAVARGSGGWSQPGASEEWSYPSGNYGASNPLRAGQTRRQFGQALGSSVSASSTVDVDSSGNGYYDQTASVH